MRVSLGPKPARQVSRVSAAKLLSEGKDAKTIIAENQRIPGLGHHLHKPVDPRSERLFAIARECGFYGKYCEVMEELGRLKKLPVNATGAIGALACELGLDWRAVRGIGVMARAVGLVGHLLEESRQPMAETIWHQTEEQATKHIKK